MKDMIFSSNKPTLTILIFTAILLSPSVCVALNTDSIIKELKLEIIRQPPRSHPFEKFHNLISANGAVISMKKHLNCRSYRGSYSEVCEEPSGKFTVYFNTSGKNVSAYYIPSLQISSSLAPIIETIYERSDGRLNRDEVYSLAQEVMIYKFNYYAPNNLVYGNDKREFTLRWKR